MSLNLDTIAAAAQRIGIATEDLAAIVQQGSAVSYGAGDYLFHESTPRDWLGIVLEGEVEIVRGAQARTVTLATLVPGAVFSEGVMLDDSPHATSAVTRQGARVWQIPRGGFGTGARGEAGRLLPHRRARRRAAQRAAARCRRAHRRREVRAPIVSAVRTEHDSLGEREVPDHAYYGVQTMRGMENFRISGIRDVSLRALRPRVRLREKGRRAGERRTRRARCRARPTRSCRRATKSSPASCTTSSSST